MGEIFENLGINNFLHDEKVKPLDKVFGLDESRHNNGTSPYGVETFHICGDRLYIEYYKGNFRDKYDIYGGNTDKANITPQQEKGVIEFCESVIQNRYKKTQRHVKTLIISSHSV